jgi:hypothetical protein
MIIPTIRTAATINKIHQIISATPFRFAVLVGEVSVSTPDGESVARLGRPTGSAGQSSPYLKACKNE